ncbi:Hypothetical_protein [Hexamita inflata]|uniref:Hypothetical_protein n=1 Tax=Hexamita inflata TaxID=28002 RepID=A0AA86R9F5_9EUKA|nr:Hypothetical protein HINF_LOCUS56049 [Hexamita inflata]
MNYNYNLPIGRKPRRIITQKVENVELSTISSTPSKQSKHSCLSDSIDMQQFSPFSCSGQIKLMDYINTSLFSVQVQIKRTDYLAGCNAKNAEIVFRLQRNQRYLNTIIKK